MSEATTIARNRLKRYRVDQNTTADTETISDLAGFEEAQNTSFFGINVTIKELRFFNLTTAKWNLINSISKGMSTKSPMAENLAHVWMYEYMTGSIPSNHGAIDKNAANSSSRSVWPIKNKTVENYRANQQSNRNIVDAGKVEIWDTCTVVSDIVTFMAYQLLSVGETIELNGTEYAVTAEITEGKAYRIDQVVADGSYTAVYEHDFTTKHWPRLSFKNILPVIS